MTNRDINDKSCLNSIWTDSIANNKQPDGKALLAHLKTVHQQHTGFTEKCASICRDKTGLNSYEWLAEIVPDIDGTRVLDLACGSGPLLKILYDRISKSRLLHKVVVATGSNKKNIKLIEYMKKEGIEFFCGSETDVLKRYIDTATHYNSKIVVRITAK